MSKLYIIPTPVGNLEDITHRALRLLGEVDFILAEDTRNSKRLLQHFGINKPLQSHHQANEHKTLQRVVEQIKGGLSVALISDAGTPGISDPGFLLVRACVREQIEVECLPGATAFVPALVVSGLPADRFVFEGFLPHKKGRQTRLKNLIEEDRTIIFYESPHRLVKMLDQIIEYFGENRNVSVSREISKKFEETIRGTAAEVAAHFKNNPVKGEFVIVVAGKESA